MRKINIRNKIYGKGAIESPIFRVLILFNAAGVIAMTVPTPVYSSVKALYYMGSIPAFLVFFGSGVMVFEKRRLARWILSFFFGGLFVLAAVHIIHIAYALGFKIGL